MPDVLEGSKIVIALDNHKGLFRDEESFSKFIANLNEALEKDPMPQVTVGNELLFTALSGEVSKLLLAERIVSRLWTNPGLLSKLKDSLEDNDIVD